jgi:hypothetical protein
MPKPLPAPSAKLNRLRAAAALIPIIESGIADSKLSVERAALMASFCEWASQIQTSDEDETQLQERIREGLQRLQLRLNSHAHGENFRQSVRG